LPKANKIVAVSLTAVLVIAVFLRFYSILQGLPFSDMIDEMVGVTGALTHASSKSLKYCIDAGYSSLFNYLLAIIYGIIFVVGKIFGFFHDKYDFALLYMTKPWIFYFTTRLLSFASGVGAIWYAWRSGRVLTGSQLGGLFSAMLLGLSTVHLSLSMIGKVDAMMTFFAAAYLYQVVKIIKKKADMRTSIVAGIFLGLAVASKINAALLAPALPVALLLGQVNRQNVIRHVKLTIIFSMVAIVFFFIGNPAFLVDFKNAVRLMSIQVSGNNYLICTAGSTPLRWIWIFLGFIKQEGAIGITFLVSFIISVYLIIFKKRYELVVPLLFIAVYVAYFGHSARAYQYYLLPIYPLFTLISGVVLTYFVKVSEDRFVQKNLWIIPVVLIVVFGLWTNISAIMLRPQNSTRVAAKTWMEKNIPSGTFIAYDDYPFCPPFFSPDVYLQSGAATQYEKFVPPPLKDKIMAYANTHTSFRSMRLRCYLNAPVFPSDWSPEFKKNFEKDPLMIHNYKLYFYSPEELYNKKVEYVVVCESFYHQFYDIFYPPDNPLYGFNLRGLAFYKELFGTNRYYAKTVEFKSSKVLSGGTIAIYRRRTP
jgi:hypothetical protein